jgi:hypothetical protein
MHARVEPSKDDEEMLVLLVHLPGAAAFLATAAHIGKCADGSSRWVFASNHMQHPAHVPMDALQKPVIRREHVPAVFPRFEYRSSQDNVDAALVVLLHGFGDSCENFMSFGRGMNLPQVGTRV